MDNLSKDTIVQGHLTSLIGIALIHNASVVQLASEIIASGPGVKQTQLKRIRNEFDRMHKNYAEEYKRITDELQKNIEAGKL